MNARRGSVPHYSGLALVASSVAKLDGQADLDDTDDEDLDESGDDMP